MVYNYIFLNIADFLKKTLFCHLKRLPESRSRKEKHRLSGISSPAALTAICLVSGQRKNTQTTYQIATDSFNPNPLDIQIPPKKVLEVYLWVQNAKAQQVFGWLRENCSIHIHRSGTKHDSTNENNPVINEGGVLPLPCTCLKFKGP